MASGVGKKRRYPRASCQHVGLVELRYRRNSSFGRSLLGVIVHSVSIGGVGVVLVDAAPMTLLRGMTMTLRVHVGNTEMELPAQVAWCSPASKKAGVGCNLGLQFQLELATSDARVAYTRWVARQIAERPRAN